MPTKVNPDQLIVISKEDLKKLILNENYKCKYYDLNKLREEALEEGFSLSEDRITLEQENMSKTYINNYIKSHKQAFLTKEIELP